MAVRITDDNSSDNYLQCLLFWLPLLFLARYLGWSTDDDDDNSNDTDDDDEYKSKYAYGARESMSILLGRLFCFCVRVYEGNFTSFPLKGKIMVVDRWC